MRFFAELRRALRPASLLLAIAVVPAVVSAWWHTSDHRSAAGQTTHAISVHEARSLARQTSVLWIDARSATNHARETIPGALPLRHPEWEDLLPAFVEAWRPGQPVVVFCDGGECDVARSISARLRREIGSDDIYYLEGGWNAWRIQP